MLCVSEQQARCTVLLHWLRTYMHTSLLCPPGISCLTSPHVCLFLSCIKMPMLLLLLQSLLDTYNIGVDPDARNKQMVEKTAARVGFKLPVEQQADQLSASLQPQQPQQPQELEQLEQVQAQHSHQPSAEQPHSASEAAAPTNSSSSIRQQPGLHVDPPASAAIAAAAAAVAAA